MRRQEAAHDAEPRFVAEGGELRGEAQRLRRRVHTSIILEVSYLSTPIRYRAGASSPASITASSTSRPSMTCLSPITDPRTRSEERRVGKECRARGPRW